MSAGKRVASIVVLPSESRVDTTSPEFINDQFRGAEFIVRQTAQGSTIAFVSVKVQGKVVGSTQYYTVATITPATSPAFTKRLVLYPGASTANNSTTLEPAAAPYVANEFLPARWRVTSTNASTSAATFSVSADLYH